MAELTWAETEYYKLEKQRDKEVAVSASRPMTYQVGACTNELEPIIKVANENRL